MNKNKVIQNLKDSGCDNQFIEKFFQLKEENNKKTVIAFGKT